MKELKFRFYDKTEKKMKFLNSIWNMPDPGYDFDDIQQFTGLFDRLGKEIYEGDIVQVIFRGKKGSKIVVEYETKTASFIPISNLLNVYGESDPMFYKVIGNIYENPELL